MAGQLRLVNSKIAKTKQTIGDSKIKLSRQSNVSVRISQLKIEEQEMTEEADVLGIVIEKTSIKNQPK